jgi:hypothetical protein
MSSLGVADSRSLDQADCRYHRAVTKRHRLAYHSVTRLELRLLDLVIVRLCDDQINICTNLFGFHRAPRGNAFVDGPYLNRARGVILQLSISRRVSSTLEVWK